MRLITLTRRLQWLLLIAAIVPSLVLIVIVSINRAKAGWLLGLSIVVGLLFVRFGSVSRKPVRILEAESMPTLREARLATEEEYVVGIVFEGTAYAFPYRALYRTPIVQLTEFNKRLLLIHSPYANSATVLEVSREVRANDLEYVASPGNSTLVYNRKYGQFIVGITGLTDQGDDPIGVRDRVPCFRMSALAWRRLHPDSKLMMPTAADAGMPGVALRPLYEPITLDSSLPAETPIVLLRTDPPVALLDGAYDRPVQTRAGDTPIALWRDSGGALRAFNRTVDTDLFLTFKITKDKKGNPKRIDNQTGSVWTDDARAIDGPLAGKRLTPITIEENVYWGVSKQWFADLQLIRLEDD